MPFIKYINIGKLYSVRETLCEGLNEEKEVSAVYRNIREMLPCLARYYTMNEGEYELLWFNEQLLHSIFPLVVMALLLARKTLPVLGWSASLILVEWFLVATRISCCLEDCFRMRRFIE